ncbi:HAMP domain-containing protein [Clostridium tetani]|uniref:HAMP domain-containing protein n=1 Tax=Clostridium tetani TaxID=1513 RepID=UPI00100BF047|nr:HAMP domain-containing protein [Clostridium tetani]RXM58366.1 hypothetical protein DP133_05905 [Clostridium tetani]RXM78688.1 hypothetical protein DP154_03905 [Clostridium tetani]RYU99712.1 hypothetical protein DP144_02265 [Clostridium tetani]
MILLIQRKVRYINVLEQEIKILKEGDLNYVITVRGNDELAFLAQEIDEMRKAFIAREQYADRFDDRLNFVKEWYHFDIGGKRWRNMRLLWCILRFKICFNHKKQPFMII